MTTVEQWQAGKSVEGVPPWDGTGIPLPVDPATGWPEVPGGGGGSLETWVLTTDQVDNARDFTLFVTKAEATDTPVYVETDAYGTWQNWGELLQTADPLVYSLALTLQKVGDDMGYRAYSPSPERHTISNELRLKIVAPPELTSIVLTATPTEGPANTSTIFDATTDQPAAGGMLMWDQSLDGGTTWVGRGSLPEVGPNHYQATEGVGATTHFRVTSGVGPNQVVSNVVVWTLTVAADPNEGWTVAELKEFAADHEPPIPIPSSANKAEILAIIVAYLHAHPEEN